jgi:hypothetical protein
MKSDKTAHWIISLITLLLSGLVLSAVGSQQVQKPVQVEQQISAEIIPDNFLANIYAQVPFTNSDYKTTLVAIYPTNRVKFSDVIRFNFGTRLGSVANLIDNSLQVKRQIQFCNNTQLTFIPLILERGFLSALISSDNGEATIYS